MATKQNDPWSLDSSPTEGAPAADASGSDPWAAPPATAQAAPPATADGQAPPPTAAPPAAAAAPPPASASGWSISPNAPQPTTVPMMDPSSASTLDNYTRLLGQVNSSDPAAASMARNELQRTTLADLTAAGHKVSMKGDQIVVDGITYEFGSGTPVLDDSLVHPGVDPSGGASWLNPPGGPATTSGAPPGGYTYDNPPTGYPQGHLNDPTYVQQLIAWAAQQPGVNPSVINDPGYWAGRFASGDFQDDTGYAVKKMFLQDGAGAGGDSGGGFGGDIGGGSVGSWMDSIDFGDKMPDPTAIDPNSIDFGGPNSDAQDQFVRTLMDNPDVIDKHTLDQMEGKQSEDEMYAAQQADEDMARFGAANGQGGSPFMAAQRASGLETARHNIITGSRDLEVNAAQMNAANRQKVAQLGADNVAAHLQKAGLITDIDKFNKTIELQAKNLKISAASLKTQLLTQLLNLQERKSEFGGNLQLQYDELQRLINNDTNTAASSAWGGA